MLRPCKHFLTLECCILQYCPCLSLSHFHQVLNGIKSRTLSEIDCDDRRLIETASNSSLAEKLGAAMESLSAALESFGIQIEFSAVPGFDSKTFVASVDVSLSATLSLTGTEILAIFERFLGNVTRNLDNLGLNSSTESQSLTIDRDQLLDNTVVSAGFDITFGVKLDIKVVQGSMSNSGEGVKEGLQEGLRLEIDSWGAFALLVVDPIELEFSFGSTTLEVRDSSFALGAYARNSGSFLTTVKEIINDSSNVAGLVPIVTIPLNVELIFDLDISGITLSPILSISEDNVNDTFSLNDFDTDLDLQYLLNNGLHNSFANANDLLKNISSYSPDLNLTEGPSASVAGLFDIIKQASNFSEGLEDFLSIVDEVQNLIPSELMPVVRQTHLLSGNGGCINPSAKFKNDTYDLLVDKGLLTGDEANFATYLPCDHLGKIQVAYNFTTIKQEVSDLRSLVVIPTELNDQISNTFGYELDAQQIVNLFQSISISRLLSFLERFFAPALGEESSDRRRYLSSSRIPITSSSTTWKSHRNRLDLFHDIRGQTTTEIIGRYLEETTIASVRVGDYLEISVGFDFGESGPQQVTFNADFSFSTDDT